MIGDGDQTVDSLQAGASSEELTFKLRKRYPGVPYPFSYGDYAGFYSQLGMQKNIFIVGPQTMTTITIDDKSYQVE